MRILLSCLLLSLLILFKGEGSSIQIQTQQQFSNNTFFSLQNQAVAGPVHIIDTEGTLYAIRENEDDEDEFSSEKKKVVAAPYKTAYNFKILLNNYRLLPKTKGDYNKHFGYASLPKYLQKRVILV